MILKSNKIQKLLESKDVVMFGAGIMSKDFVESYNTNVKYYVDNNSVKWGTEYLGREIKNPNDMIKDKGHIIIFIGSQYVTEISKQLDKMGFKRQVDYYTPRDLEEKTIQEEAGIYIDTCESNFRLLLDMSQLAWTNNAPGVSRVVKNLVNVSYSQDNYRVIATQRAGNYLFEPSKWLEDNKMKVNNTNYFWNKVNYKKNDILLLPDAIWGQYDKFDKVIEEVHSKGGKVINLIYDIIPIEHPERCDRFMINNFKNMLSKVLQNSDGIITDSKTVADKIISLISKESIKIKEDFKIGWLHIGFSPKNFINNNIENENIKSIIKEKPFIIVGTIEPRKGHVFALDAFEELWEKGSNLKLCIIGKVGWNVEKLVERIKGHEEYGKKLFFIEYPTDEELAYCYRNSEALIFPSIDEGFGLPLIEAASFKLPLILSDIEIFRELANDNALYFKSANPKDLKDTIIKYVELKSNNLLPQSEKIKINTWEDTFNSIIEIIYKDNWYKTYR